MQVVEKAFLPPSVCFICEAKPVEGIKVVDTLREFDPVGLTPINGRKYVCENCVAQMAKLVGFERGDQVAQAKVDLQVAREEIAQLQERARQVGEMLVGNAPLEEPLIRELTPKAKARKNAAKG